MATNLEPSAEDTMVLQFVAGALVCTQVTPELVEIKINEFLMVTNLVPSAEQAIGPACVRELTGVKLLPEFVEV